MGGRSERARARGRRETREQQQQRQRRRSDEEKKRNIAAAANAKTGAGDRVSQRGTRLRSGASARRRYGGRVGISPRSRGATVERRLLRSIPRPLARAACRRRCSTATATATATAPPVASPALPALPPWWCWLCVSHRNVVHRPRESRGVPLRLAVRGVARLVSAVGLQHQQRQRARGHRQSLQLDGASAKLVAAVADAKSRWQRRGKQQYAHARR